MPFAAALSNQPNTTQALEEVCKTALEQLATAPQLAILFYSPHHMRKVSEIAEFGNSKLAANCFLGVPGETIIGNDKEIEGGPAMALWLGSWSQEIQLTPFHLYLEQTSEGLSLLGWPDNLDNANPEGSVVLMLADPFTFPIDVFLGKINDEIPGLRIVGGMASGIHSIGECRMILGDKQIDQGAVGVLMEGPLQVRPVVSQGCRPIGKHMVITKAKDNVILELGGKTPLQQIQELWDQLDEPDQRLLERGLHVGRVINEYQGEFQRGDFLVRNVMGLDRDSGSLTITDHVRVGQTVQFHVRDAESADEDLHALLQMDIAAHEKRPASGLLFSCNGRGTRLFPEPDHDAKVVQTEAGALPLAGFFAQGEIGPVGGKNFIHGFTASVVLFEE